MNLSRRLVRRLRRRASDRPGAAAWLKTEPAPPACPPGWTVGPPDFIGVGAQKAGTTWWFHLIAAHPDVYHSPELRPELHFWDRFPRRSATPDDVARYHRLFPRPPGAATGEKTPEYMSYYWVPAMLRAAAPDARVIVLLRDPIERYLSARAHGVARGWTEDATNEETIFARGLYAWQLRNLRAHFPSDRVLVLQYERCVREPEAELARTYEFLGLKPHTLTEEELRRGRNVSKESKAQLSSDRVAALRDAYASDVRLLTQDVPGLDVGLWPNFANLD
jgi:hypothetical protein